MKLEVKNGSDSHIERYYGNAGDFIKRYNHTVMCKGHQIIRIKI